MRAKSAIIWIIGLAFGQLVNIILPDIIKHAIYAYLTDFLVHLIGLWWASMIAFLLTNAIPIIAGLGLILLTFWLRIGERQEVVESGIMSETRLPSTIPLKWALVGAIALIIGASAIMKVIYKNEVPLFDIKLYMANAVLFPPGEDTEKNPCFADIYYSAANNHPIVGVTHFATLKFSDKLLSREEEDVEMRALDARIPPPRADGNELYPGKPYFFSVNEKSITLNEWKRMLTGTSMIYVFAKAKYFGADNAEKIRATEFCAFITQSLVVMNDCLGHNHTYTEQ
jgi:hypothetical protein